MYVDLFRELLKVEGSLLLRTEERKLLPGQHVSGSTVIRGRQGEGRAENFLFIYSFVHLFIFQLLTY